MEKLLSDSEVELLEKSLFYLKMHELRKICLKLYLPHAEKKGKLIQKILFFVKTGKVVSSLKIPENSTAKKLQSYPLKPESYILYGSYKNNSVTREFFKSIIGKHFHFTAFGMDWINQRWMEDNPPTYQEFALFWQDEYERRKIKKMPAKKEWAYISFVQDYITKYPHASRNKIMDAWKKERIKHLKCVEKILINFYRES